MTVPRPVLVYPLRIVEDRLALKLETDSDRITVEGVSPSLGSRIIERLNGSGDGLPEFDGDAREFVELLLSERLGLVHEPDYYSGVEICRLLQRYFLDWNDALFSHLLWTSLAAGTAKSSVVDGWLIETYHFIKGANARLSYAASQTTDLACRSAFVHHYVEEYDHYKFFGESLERRGISVADVERIGPLPSTTGVMNMARRAARTDHLAYAACSGLLESTGSDAARAREFYRLVANHYDKESSDFVEPMLRHVALDEAYEHGSVMAEIFSGVQAITPARAAGIIETVSIFRDTLLLWFDDVLRHYHLQPFEPHRTHRHARRSNRF